MTYQPHQSEDGTTKPIAGSLHPAALVCCEAYQVVGSLLSDLGKFDTPEAQRVLDNLSQARKVHDNVLPWPSFKAYGELTKALSDIERITRSKGMTDADRKAALRDIGECARAALSSPT